MVSVDLPFYFFYQQAGKDVPTGERGKISVLV